MEKSIFENVTMTYRAAIDPALAGLTVRIGGGESVGVVGRTGAGKSSLVVALFRLVDLTSGSIVVDGVDISRVPKTILRSRMTLVAQDPITFAGSVRYNLDPFNEYTDAEIWSALEQSSMKTNVSSHARVFGGQNREQR